MMKQAFRICRKVIVPTLLVAAIAVVPVMAAGESSYRDPLADTSGQLPSSDEDPHLQLQASEDLLIFEDASIDRHNQQLAGMDAQTWSGGLQEDFIPLVPGTEPEASGELSKHEHMTELLKEQAREKEIREEKARAAAREKEIQAEKARKAAKEAESKVQAEGQPSGDGAFLIQLSNPDKNYRGQPLQVSDRKALEGLVMGEWGNDYIGAVLVAQCIRDSMLKEGTNSAAVIKRKFGYTAPIRTKVSDTVKRAVAYVFDEGGSGVQHPIYYFYASNLVNSRWHETQKFIVQRKAVRFFSPWK